MIPIADFEQTARERLLDAECLLAGNRFDGAVYLAGYVLEIAFKVRLCKTHGVLKFPSESKECYAITKPWFNHKITTLKDLCALNLPMTEWSNVKNWDVEARYIKSNETSQSSSDFLDSVKVLLAIII
jgi:hypothetical protein